MFSTLSEKKFTSWATLKLTSANASKFGKAKILLSENSKKLPKRVENTVGKGEITRYEQFLLFPHCFQKACFPGASKGVTVWEWVNQYVLSHFSHQN